MICNCRESGGNENNSNEKVWEIEMESVKTMQIREKLKDKRRIVIKVGTSTITYEKTGNINLDKLEKFVRVLINLLNSGKEVIVVSSGSIAIGRKVLGLDAMPTEDAEKKACAAVGQGRLMMIYEKFFAEYSQLTAQMLLTKESISDEECRVNARNAFDELIRRHVVPIVNENDAIAVNEEMYGIFGDNDTMAAQVAELIDADLLILMSDIEGLYTDDPRTNPGARFVHTVATIDEDLEGMGKGAGTDGGTGGMRTKIEAAKIATQAGADMIIANGANIYTINDIMAGKKVGTLFLSKEHTDITENELSPEVPHYRRATKRVKKEGSKAMIGGSEYV
ncbi:glutamate 5-kinase [Hespellia stercorisuis DSM 15480]|uniref:Glutamate 5-kinase n=2 Tax=Hespellia stercorisuis TaxID=180311 RepID=A0A1M6MP61_9FIRM|nr:glutamate 5-kinase [Hespellia stercorisuis]SHJ85209.1 glutamate 5-kinase [Hespellia stercorisuis DSM 15480]